MIDLLNKTDFYSLSGIDDSQVNDIYVTRLLASVNASIESKLGNIFTLTEDTSKKYYRTISDNIVIIGNWQNDITVNLKSDDSTDSNLLTAGTEYRLIPHSMEDAQNSCVVAVKLYGYRLTDYNYLEISGTYGYQDGVPAELMLDIEIYDLLKKCVFGSESETNTGGLGGLVSSSIDKVRVQYDTSKTMTFKEAFSAINDLLDTVKDQYTFSSYDFSSIIG